MKQAENYGKICARLTKLSNFAENIDISNPSEIHSVEKVASAF